VFWSEDNDLDSLNSDSSSIYASNIWSSASKGDSYQKQFELKELEETWKNMTRQEGQVMRSSSISKDQFLSITRDLVIRKLIGKLKQATSTSTPLAGGGEKGGGGGGRGLQLKLSSRKLMVDDASNWGVFEYVKEKLRSMWHSLSSGSSQYDYTSLGSQAGITVEVVGEMQEHIYCRVRASNSVLEQKVYICIYTC
jgi:hypothetical protein